MKKLVLSFIFLVFLSSQINPQNTYLGYSFDPWGYEYYTELTNATVSTATGDDGAENINLPFTFDYMGLTYSTARISVNGWLEMGQSYTGPGNENDFLFTAAKPIICPLWDDLNDDELSEIRYKTMGLAPAREFIVEWSNILVGSSRKSFQVRLFELDGTIAFHYGPQIQSSAFSATIGMNDNIGGHFHFISITPGTFVTADTVASNNNISTFENIEQDKNFYFIPNGRTFQITTHQLTENVIKGSVNQPVIAILITSRQGILTMPSVTSISLSTNGTSNTSDILNAKLFYTGINPYFNTNYQIGNTVYQPNGNFSINGGGYLQDYATNYIWLTYDVSDSAQIGNVLDAEALQIFFDLTFSRTPDVTAPAGSRTIIGGEGLAGTYTVGTSGDFLSLTEIVDSLAESFITAPITVELLNDYDSANEIFPISFPFIFGNSAQNKITIRPSLNAADISINGYGNAILRFSNAANLIIDGRPGGIGESRELTIQNLDTSGSAILVTNDSKNILISHSNILGCSVSENKGVVEFSFSDLNLSSENVTISNCFVGKSFTGRPANCFYFGSTAYGGIAYWKISNCSITDFTSIGVNFETGYTTTIENSEIYLTEPSPKNKVSGIKMIEPVNSLRIERNKIHSLSSNLSSTNYITGIEIPFSSYHDIMNNFITLSGNEYSQVTGIDYSGAWASYDSIFNNTIYIYGNSINEQNSYCFRRRAHQYYGGLSLRLKNNILINKRNNTQGFGWHYAIAIEDERGLHQIDFNNYYAAGTGTVLGRWLSYDVTSINEWQSFTQKDEQSISKNVNFISSTDLHLTGTSLGDEDLIAQPNNSVLVDIDNEPRNLYFPYMGADESTDYPLPVELTSFTATVFNNKTTLNWSTASELNNTGFGIEKSFFDEKSKSFMEWKTIGFVPGKGTAVSKQEYSYIDDEEIFCKTAYRLKQIDFDGSYNNSFLIEVAPQLPKEFSISQNYPNPFNPGTVIKYQLPVNSKVIIKVYDILGKEIATLVNEVKPAGKYEINFNAAQFTSGVYLYKIHAGNYIQTKKMILIK